MTRYIPIYICITLIIIAIIYSFYSVHESFVPLLPGGVNQDNLIAPFPHTGRNSINEHSEGKTIWWHFPILHLSSYKQITNNLKYVNNPDNGRCMPASMCGAFYKEHQDQLNEIQPLPPLNPKCGLRIGYFQTSNDVNMLPFRTSMQNILF